MKPASISRKLGWYCALCAVITEFTVSGNLLTDLGSSYISEGGIFLQKIHPGSYLAIVSGICTVISRRFRAGPSCLDARLAGFLGGIAVCSFYAIALTGAGNVVVFIDTFFSAGMLALALADLGELERRRLRHVAQCLIILNACIALTESCAQSHLVGIPSEAIENEREFRPTALYDHALTGATVTMIGLWLTPLAPGMGKWCYVSVLFAALLAFGERTPIAAILFCLLAWAISHYKTQILARDVHCWKLALPAAAGLAFVGAAAALCMNMGTRLGTHLYWDQSAQVRLSQFNILTALDGSELLFGCPRANLLALIEPLRLSSHVAVIENFWLFTLVALGFLCFPIFVLSFVSFMKWLWHLSSTNGHFMLVLFVAVTSASNSLGRKSTLLVTLVACVVASTASVAPARSTALLGVSASWR